MKNNGQQRLKAHYQSLRNCSCTELWEVEIPKFESATERDRLDQVSVIRAAGVVFSESGTPEQKENARKWLRRLLADPEEKIRRYAMAALPKLGSGTSEEQDLLELLKKASSERETQALAKTLEKIGGEATLNVHQTGTTPALNSTVQKLHANIARQQHSSHILFKAPVDIPGGVSVNLRCRSGLESILTAEVGEKLIPNTKFQVLRSIPKTLTLHSQQAFTLEELYAVRTFSTASFLLGTVQAQGNELPLDAFAQVIATPVTDAIFRTLTSGPIRYRIEFHFNGVSNHSYRTLADKVFRAAPSLLNDPKEAPWEISIHRIPRGYSIELSARLRPDPRFAYRRGDVPAASHPPLSAALARLAGIKSNEIVWDPFCGSGLELIERGLLGGVDHLIGTDLSNRAIETTRDNISAAFPAGISSTLVCCDFREYRNIKALQNVSLIISNPPLGKRVPVKELDALVRDLFEAAATVLRPGGSLVFVNPLSIVPDDSRLKLITRKKVDLGCCHCWVEKHQKSGGK
ncbi:MAG: methyltransferase [Verrucomicrobiota bacterium]